MHKGYTKDHIVIIGSLLFIEIILFLIGTILLTNLPPSLIFILVHFMLLMIGFIAVLFAIIRWIEVSSMSFDSKSGNNDEYEEIILEHYKTMKLDSNEETEIEKVALVFEKVDTPSERFIDYLIEDDGTLHLLIRDTTLEDGVKYSLAFLSYELHARYILAPYRHFFAPCLLPLITMVVPLLLFGEFALGNLAMSIVVGPLLYLCISIPFLLYLTKKRMSDVTSKHDRMRTYLERSTLFTPSEVTSFTSKFARTSPLHYLIDYLVFIPILLTFMWLVFYLNM